MVCPDTPTVLMPAPAMVIAPFKLLTEDTAFPVVKQFGHVRLPEVALSTNGLDAETAIVPEASGTVSVRVVLVLILDKSNCAFFVLSVESWRYVVVLSKVLFMNVWVWFKNAKVSLALSAGTVAIRFAVGATLLIVVVLVVPRTSWLVVGVTFNPPLSVKPAKFGLEEVAMDCGSDRVIAPVPAETLTWLEVPVSEVTPLLVIVIVPEPLLIPIAVPAVRLVKLKPEPLPIKSLPLPAVEVSSPVPPLAFESCA